MQLDQVLQLVGANGKYHMIVFACVSLITIRDPWQLLGISFIGFETPHSCRDPLPDNGTSAAAAAAAGLNVSRSAVSSDGRECAPDAPDRCRARVNATSNETEPCQHGWRYESEFVSAYHYELEYETTIVMEWDLVCEKSGLVELSTTVYMVGVLVGSILTPLSDKFGRKRVMLLALWLQGALGIARAFATDYVQFIVLGFFIGTAFQISVLVGYVYLVELYPASSRTGPGIFVQVFWGVGVALMALIAFLFKNWRYFQLVISLPSLLFIPLYWIMPESVVWLVNKGRIHEAERILHNAARINGKSLPMRCLTEVELLDPGSEAAAAPHDWPSKACDEPACRLAHPTRGSEQEKLHQQNAAAERPKSETVATADLAARIEGQVKHTAIDLFRTPTMRLYTLVLFLIWFTVSGNYLALSLNASELYGNKYLNFGLGGLVEIPAYLITAPVLQRFGRKRPLMFFTILCGLATVATIAVSKASENDCTGTHMQYVTTAIAMIGKFGITASYGILYLMAPEIFPTSVRTAGVGLCSICDTIGGMGAPLIGYMSTVLPWLQAAVLGTLAIVAGVSVLMLPETHNRLLPTKVKDVEAWAKECNSCCRVCRSR